MSSLVEQVCVAAEVERPTGIVVDALAHAEEQS